MVRAVRFDFMAAQCLVHVVYTVLDTLEKENAVENAATIGAYIVDQLRAELIDQNVQVRGFGMMIGIQLPKIVLNLLRLHVMNIS